MQSKKFPSARTVKRAIAAAAGASALLMAGAAQATLEDRDLDGDTVVDALYDNDLDITWLRNANVNGRMNWDSAVAWAASFSSAGYDDWRLPTSDECWGSNCTGSEMGHLWYIELGNTAGSMTNTGSFQNLLSNLYWSGTEVAPTPDDAWYFDTGGGRQEDGGKGLYFYAMAVRPGNVATVPEPQTYALLLTGLTALAVVRRRRPD